MYHFVILVFLPVCFFLHTSGRWLTYQSWIFLAVHYTPGAFQVQVNNFARHRRKFVTSNTEALSSVALATAGPASRTKQVQRTLPHRDQSRVTGLFILRVLWDVDLFYCLDEWAAEHIPFPPILWWLFVFAALDFLFQFNKCSYVHLSATGVSPSSSPSSCYLSAAAQFTPLSLQNRQPA